MGVRGEKKKKKKSFKLVWAICGSSVDSVCKPEEKKNKGGDEGGWIV